MLCIAKHSDDSYMHVLLFLLHIHTHMTNRFIQDSSLLWLQNLLPARLQVSTPIRASQQVGEQGREDTLSQS